MVRRRSMLQAFELIAACGVVCMSGAYQPLGAASQQQASDSTTAPVTARQAVLKRYCITCHNQRLKTARLELDSVDVESPAAHPEVWEKVIRKLRTSAMPPPGAPRPDQATSASLASWLENEIDRVADARSGAAPTRQRVI